MPLPDPADGEPLADWERELLEGTTGPRAGTEKLHATYQKTVAARLAAGDRWGASMVEAAYLEALRYNTPDTLAPAVATAYQVAPADMTDTSSGYNLRARAKIRTAAEQHRLTLYRP